MATQEYQTFLSANKVVRASSNRDAEMVNRVGSRIADAIKTYYDGIGQHSVLEGYQWEFNLVDNKEVNAWCMPGIRFHSILKSKSIEKLKLLHTIIEYRNNLRFMR